LARPRAWGDTLIENNFTATAQNFLVNLLADLSPSDTVTAMRLIIRFRMVPSNLSDNMSGEVRIDLGIGVAAKEAFDLGTTALPDPSVAEEVPARGWLWRSRMVATGQEEAALGYQIYDSDTLTADVRAMRKVDRGILYLRAKVREANPTDFASMRLTGIVRVLCAT